jgi:hypothetical protein
MAAFNSSYSTIVRVTNLEIDTDVTGTSSDGYALILEEDHPRQEMEVSMNKIHKIYLEDPNA